ncbi:UNKNOWN [Stylonychia lemnae]|uniref:Uncharacterized protein n=1 Tax=Stylonychia lemnae TaxID=5949 RepID=A0A078A3C9_STYLE|nr:UNKNOWN [Stylonychia lemnae]|eukprot:CDW76677.1 UNKNOWN [Stylonychia lemnae]
MFKFDLKQDMMISSRLEVKLQTKSENARKKSSKKDQIIMIHSKLAGQGLPYQDWNAFQERLQDAVRQYRQMKQIASI